MLELIVQAIKNSSLTRREIASRLGVAPQNLSRMLKNDDIRLSAVYRLSEILEIPIKELLPSAKIPPTQQITVTFPISPDITTRISAIEDRLQILEKELKNRIVDN